MRPDRITAHDRYIGARIKEARLAMQLTQKGVAELLGVSYQQLQKYEDGSNRCPAARIERLVSILNRPLEYFFPNLTDVRGRADPLVTQFIGSRQGYTVAANWLRLAPETREYLEALIVHLAKVQTYGS